MSFCNSRLTRLEPFIYIKRGLRRLRPNPGKPPILPPSKQVLYRVVNGDWIKPEYVKELLWRRHVYNNAMVSIQKIFQEENRIAEKAGLGIENLKKQEQLELNTLIKENEKLNEEMAILREKKYKQHLEEVRQETIKEIKDTLVTEAADMEKRNAEVQKFIDHSVNFVTLENLEERITNALENPVVFDFAIDLSGRKFYSPAPVKYIEGQPTRQKGRQYDVTHSQKLG